jgi:putative endonuclease
MWYVYILYNEEANKYYIGITNDLEKRLIKHNSGKGAKTTRMFKNWYYVYYLTLPNKSSSLKKEYELKQLTRKQKEDFLKHQSNNITINRNSFKGAK